MLLTLEALTILDAIERKGSFARAAEELARAPSSLTYAVQQMEPTSTCCCSTDPAIAPDSPRRPGIAGRRPFPAGRCQRAGAQDPAGCGWLGDGLRSRSRAFCRLRRCCPCSMRFINWARLPSQAAPRSAGGWWDALASGRADLVIAAATRLPAAASAPARWAASNRVLRGTAASAGARQQTARSGGYRGAPRGGNRRHCAQPAAAQRGLATATAAPDGGRFA